MGNRKNRRVVAKKKQAIKSRMRELRVAKLEKQLSKKDSEASTSETNHSATLSQPATKVESVEETVSIKIKTEPNSIEKKSNIDTEPSESAEANRMTILSNITDPKRFGGNRLLDFTHVFNEICSFPHHSFYCQSESLKIVSEIRRRKRNGEENSVFKVRCTECDIIKDITCKP